MAGEMGAYVADEDRERILGQNANFLVKSIDEKEVPNQAFVRVVHPRSGAEIDICLDLKGERLFVSSRRNVEFVIDVFEDEVCLRVERT